MAFWPSQTLLGGEPLESLIRKAADASETTKHRVGALDQLAQKGAEAKAALPALKEVLKDKDAILQVSAARAIWKIEGKADAVMPILLANLTTYDFQARTEAETYAAGIAAAGVLGEIGPPAGAAITLLYRETVRSTYAHSGQVTPFGDAARAALAKIEPDRAMLLIEAFADVEMLHRLHSSNGYTRQYSIPVSQARTHLGSELARMGSGVLSKVATAMSHQREQVRLGAVKAGAYLAPTGLLRKETKALLRDESLAVRISAADALHQNTGSADDSVPVLVAAIKGGGEIKDAPDNQAALRLEAAEILFRISGRAEDSIPVLVASLRNKRSSERAGSLLAAMIAANKANPPIPVLIDALADGPGAALALGAMGQKALGPLVAALKEENPNIRYHALIGLKMIHGDVRPAVLPVSLQLKDKSEKVDLILRESLAALTHFGPQAAPAVPALIAAYQEKRLDPYGLGRVLQAIGPAAEDAAPVFLDVLGQPKNRESFDFAVLTILRIAPKRTDQVVTILSSHLVDPKIRPYALHALEVDIVNHLLALNHQGRAVSGSPMSPKSRKKVEAALPTMEAWHAQIVRRVLNLPESYIDFTSPDAAKLWTNGGAAESSFRITDAKTLEFFGTLAPERKLGHAGVWRPMQPGKLDLKQGDVLHVRVRGDGREYAMTAHVLARDPWFSSQAPLPTKKDEWIEVRIPFENFKGAAGALTFLGFKLDDQKAGPFKLEVAWIKVVRATAKQEPLRAEGKFLAAVNQHQVKLEPDTLYEVSIAGQDFRADFKIEKVSFFYRPSKIREVEDAIRGVQGYVLVNESKEYSYKVWPKSFPYMPTAKELTYQATFKPRPLATPFFSREAELTTQDPLHKTLMSKHKAFSLTLQPEQTVVIQVRYEKHTINPIIELDKADFAISRYRGRPSIRPFYGRRATSGAKVLDARAWGCGAER